MNLFSASPTIQWFCDNGGTARMNDNNDDNDTDDDESVRKTIEHILIVDIIGKIPFCNVNQSLFTGSIFISLIFQYCRARFACCYLSIVDSWQISGFSVRHDVVPAVFFFCDYLMVICVSSRMAVLLLLLLFPYSFFLIWPILDTGFFFPQPNCDCDCRHYSVMCIVNFLVGANGACVFCWEFKQTNHSTIISIYLIFLLCHSL